MAGKTGPSVDALISSGQVIEFHNPRGIYSVIKFPAFLTEFSDTVTANFEEKNVYARMDPIFNFQNTTRQISFGVVVPAHSIEEAKDNLKKIKRLQHLLYPTYSKVAAGVNILTAPPLFQIKFNNLIEDGGNKLFGVIESFELNPNLDEGMFYEGRKFYPKSYAFNCSFRPLHSSLSKRAHIGSGKAQPDNADQKSTSAGDPDKPPGPWAPGGAPGPWAPEGGTTAGTTDASQGAAPEGAAAVEQAQVKMRILGVDL